MTRSLLRTVLATLFLGFAASANAQGTLSLSLQQQFSFSGCASTPTTAACGQPLSGGLLYFYQVGTVATRQDSFQDPGLTLLNPWPLPLDANGRVPAFYLASGSIHVRLTDSFGVQQFDYPNALVIGPSGAGGGGSSIDPTTIAATGDMKFRVSADTITGWVKMNGTTIGNATSGATQRANADTQNLFVYLWTICAQPSSNTYCVVGGGLGASALADFNASKTITITDMRGKLPAGLDGMGTSRQQTIPDAAIRSAGMAGTITGDSYGGFGGFAFQAIAQNQLPNIVPIGSFSGNAVTPTGSFTGNQQTVNTNDNVSKTLAVFGSGSFNGASQPTSTTSVTFTPTGSISINAITPTGSVTVSSINGNVSQQNLLTMAPFVLGTWYIKL